MNKKERQELEGIRMNLKYSTNKFVTQEQKEVFVQNAITDLRLLLEGKN